MLRFSPMLLLIAASGVAAQTFTTAAEVKPILSATKPSWIAVREYDGRDLLYFTNLLAWRCGVTSVSYGLNGGAEVALEMEPCHDDSAQPNALLMETVQPYVAADLGSVGSVSVTVTFDDGTVDTALYDRKAVLIP